MFLTLLFVTLIIAVVVSAIVERVFRGSLAAILEQLVRGGLASAWLRYLSFAIYVVGISGGVRIWELEKYITPRAEEVEPLVLNADRWTLEVYRTIVGTLQSIAWMLLVFFVFALVAYVVLRGFALWRGAVGGQPGAAGADGTDDRSPSA